MPTRPRHFQPGEVLTEPQFRAKLNELVDFVISLEPHGDGRTIRVTETPGGRGFEAIQAPTGAPAPSAAYSGAFAVTASVTPLSVDIAAGIVQVVDRYSTFVGATLSVGALSSGYITLEIAVNYSTGAVTITPTALTAAAALLQVMAYHGRLILAKFTASSGVVAITEQLQRGGVGWVSALGETTWL